MKKAPNILLLFSLILIMSCGGKEEKKKPSFSYDTPAASEKKVETAKKAEAVPASKRVELDNKGVGPIKSLSLPAEVDQKMAAHGAEVFKNMCTACHRPDKKFIGPPPAGILERRSPEWVMNMILNPEAMVKDDPLAKDLLIEFNGSPMANQGLSEDDARAVLEYFRTL